MPTLFKAKSNEGYIIKILAELFQHNIQTACFVVSKKGITLRMMDTYPKVLFDLELLAENFTSYKYKSETKELFWGINLNHFHKMLKSTKKKDSIVLFVKDSQPNDLGIQIIPKENNRITTSYVKIQSMQNVNIPLPSGYTNPVIVPSNDYQKMCKDMSHIASVMKIRSKNSYITFYCNAGDVYSREVAFGEMDDDSDSEDDENMYDFSFDTEQMCRLVKIAGLSNRMQVYTHNELPLFFKSRVGTLGTLGIYIKSNEQLEKEELGDI